MTHLQTISWELKIHRKRMIGFRKLNSSQNNYKIIMKKHKLTNNSNKCMDKSSNKRKTVLSQVLQTKVTNLLSHSWITISWSFLPKIHQSRIIKRVSIIAHCISLHSKVNREELSLNIKLLPNHLSFSCIKQIRILLRVIILKMLIRWTRLPL